MKLTHPDVPKSSVETDNPEAYLSQGWVDTKKNDGDKPPAK